MVSFCDAITSFTSGALIRPCQKDLLSVEYLSDATHLPVVVDTMMSMPGSQWVVGLNRRFSHGLGWPANTILFLPFVKGNQKL